MKKLSACLLLICALIIFTGAAYEPAPVLPSRNFYMNDFASVIFNEHRELIVEASGELYEKTGAQAVVLTVESLSDLPIDEWGRLIVSGWPIGGDGGNGVLIIYLPDENLFHITVGDGLSEALPTKLAAEIKRSFYANIQTSTASYAIINAYRRVVNTVFDYYGVAPGETLAFQLIEYNASRSTMTFWGIAFFVVALLAVFRSFRTSAKYRARFKFNHRKRLHRIKSNAEREEKLTEVYKINGYDSLD